MKKLAVLLTVAFGVTSTPVCAESIKCDRAFGTVETTICASPTLKGLDTKMSAQLSAALLRTNHPELVKGEQQIWLKSTRNVCQDNACFEAAYTQRIAALTSDIAAIGPPADTAAVTKDATKSNVEPKFTKILQTKLFRNFGFTMTEVYPLSFSNASVKASLDQLAATGATTVNFSWPTLTVNYVPIDKLIASIDGFADTIDYARSLGLKVELNPKIFGPKYQWSGIFEPDHPDEWFHAYGDILVKYALIAQQHGVSRFYLTNEAGRLNTNPAYFKYWKEIVGRVRDVYKGEIGVNAIFDNHGRGNTFSGEAADITYTSLLDVIGLSVYIPLSAQQLPTRAQLEQAWRNNRHGFHMLKAMENLHNKTGKPIVISEVAYFAAEGFTATNDTRSIGKLSYSAQTDAYIAMFSALSKVHADWFLGVNIWGWYSDTDPIPKFEACKCNNDPHFKHGGTAIQDNPVGLQEISVALKAE